MEKLCGGIVLVIPAYALCKGLGSDVLATIESKLECMFALDVADVVNNLVEVLDS